MYAIRSYGLLLLTFLSSCVAEEARQVLVTYDNGHIKVQGHNGTINKTMLVAYNGDRRSHFCMFDSIDNQDFVVPNMLCDSSDLISYDSIDYNVFVELGDNRSYRYRGSAKIVGISLDTAKLLLH